jgi:hypothetical protein
MCSRSFLIIPLWKIDHFLMLNDKTGRLFYPGQILVQWRSVRFSGLPQCTTQRVDYKQAHAISPHAMSPLAFSMPLGHPVHFGGPHYGHAALGRAYTSYG